MKILGNEFQYRRLSTPRTAAIAGILFGLLFITSLVLLRTSIPELPSSDTDWIEQGAGRITLALKLMPFAGIAFLWFIGVVRDRLGNFEDQFFSTVFFGSGLLFLAMVFVAMSIAGGLVAWHESEVLFRIDPEGAGDYQLVFFVRSMMFQLSNVYALRMAGVFMISLGTIWLRTRIYSRWLVALTYLLALVLLLIIDYSLWVALIFPVWVMIISIEVLVIRFRQKGSG
jgi:hypothetical protein